MSPEERPILTMLSKLVVRVADLVEAEGRSLRRGLIEIVTGIVIFIAGVALCGAGVVMLLIGSWQMLANVWGNGPASLFVGALGVVLGGSLAWVMIRKIQ